MRYDLFRVLILPTNVFCIVLIHSDKDRSRRTPLLIVLD